MRPDEFLEFAVELSKGRKEIEYRSSVSRAYYFVFHTLKLKIFMTLSSVKRQALFGNAKQLLHKSLIVALDRLDDIDIKTYTKSLNDFRVFRGKADYDISKQFTQKHAEKGIGIAEGLRDDFNEIGATKFIDLLKAYYNIMWGN